MSTDTESLARELHDVSFAWSHSMLPFDSMDAEQRQWFTERAERMIADGWRKGTAEET